MPYHVVGSDGETVLNYTHSHWRIQWGGGCNPRNPPLNFPKNSGHPRGRCDRFTRLAVVIELVASSSNNACLCALNSVDV